MLRASTPTITRPAAVFIRPFAFRVSDVTHYKSFHSATTTRQGQQRESLDGSPQHGDNLVHDPDRQEAVEELRPGPTPPRSGTTEASGKKDAISFSYEAHPPKASPSSESSPAQNDEFPSPSNLKHRLREWSEQTAIVIRARADDFTARSKTTFSQFGAQLNKVTGYEEIEALKRRVVEQEQSLNDARQAARGAKRVYQQAVVQRSNSQREVNELLQRKSLWTDSDVGRFTTLVRQDHLYEQEEQRAKAAVDETEDGVDRKFSQLMRTILARYHEEQVWSDKIRSASTYGSLAALGLNLVVFILAIVVVEPWKRRNLSKAFQKQIQELSTENAAKLDASMQEIGKHLAQQEQLMEGAKEHLRAKLDELGELERERHGRRETESEPVSDAAKSGVRGRQLEMVAAGFGAGACIATLLSWLWTR